MIAVFENSGNVHVVKSVTISEDKMYVTCYCGKHASNYFYQAPSPLSQDEVCRDCLKETDQQGRTLFSG